MTIAEFVGRLGLDIDTSAFTRGEKALEQLKQSYASIAGVVQQVGAAVGELVGDLVGQAAAIDAASKATGINAQSLQELAFAASAGGASTEALSAGLTSLTRVAGAAADGSAQAQDAFAKLGVGVRGAGGEVRSADELLADLADAFAGMPPGIEKTSAAMDLFGNAGRQLVPFLDQGSAGIEALREEARALGIVLDEETIGAGAGLGDSLTKLQRSATGLRNMIAGPLLVPLRKLVDGFTEWWKLNQLIIKDRIEQVFQRLEPVFRGVAAALRVVGDVMGYLLDNSQLLTPILGAVAAMYAVVAGAALIAGIKAAAAWVLATWPLLLLGALIAILADDIHEFVTGGESLIGDFVYAMTEAWTMATDAIGEAWDGLGEWIGGVWDDVKTDAAAAFTWIVEKAKDAVNLLGAPFRKIKELWPFGKKVADLSEGGVDAAFGGGASSAAAAAGSVSNSSRSVNVNAPVEVKVSAAPGQEAAAGAAVGDAFEGHMGRVLSEAAATAGA